MPGHSKPREIWVWPPSPKKTWGPRGWNWLHVLAISYPAAPTLEEGRVAFRRIWNFVNNLPCPECRYHATRYVFQHPPDLSGTYALQSWVWEFHNAVNRRLGKKEISYSEYLAVYSNEICWANWSEGCLIAAKA